MLTTRVKSTSSGWIWWARPNGSSEDTPMRYALLLVAAILPLGALAAQESQPASAHPRQAHVTTPAHLNWGPAPAILPAGASLAVLEGDPSKAGPFTMRLAMP